MGQHARGRLVAAAILFFLVLTDAIAAGAEYNTAKCTASKFTQVGNFVSGRV